MRYFLGIMLLLGACFAWALWGVLYGILIVVTYPLTLIPKRRIP